MNASDFPFVAIVMAVFNNKAETEAGLRNLMQITYPNYKIIVVDDGSTDGTSEMVRREFPNVVLVQGGGDWWWTKCTNTGVRRAIEIGARYILIAENDHRGEPGFLQPLVASAERNARAITYSKVRRHDQPDRIYHTGWKVNWLGGGLVRTGVNELDRGQYDRELDSAACNVNMLINTAFFQDLGFFDEEKMPQYWSDIDFTYRAFKKGYRNILVPTSVIWNKGGATSRSDMQSGNTSLVKVWRFLSTSRRSGNNFREAWAFYRRHCPRLLLPYQMTRNLVSVVGMGVKWKLNSLRRTKSGHDSIGVE